MQADTHPPDNWKLEINPRSEMVQTLRDHLREFNRQQGHTHEGIGLGIFIRDEEEQLIGGVSAYLWGVTLEVDYLWLADSLRGQGIGQKLLTQIEKAAVERGAKQAVLSTFSFQSPEFYLKLGYEVTAVIEDLGDGHKKFYLSKRL